MKKTIVFSLLGFVLAAFSFIDSPQTLAGRWQQRGPNGTMMQVLFRADSSYTISINGKYFLGGKYYVNKDTMRISDPACDVNYYGTYKLSFFALDSVRLMVVQDTCAPRRRGYDKGTIGRVKTERLNSSK